MNEISSSTPPNSKDKMMELPPSTSGASLGSSLALDCASGPKSLHLQGSKAGASLPCADSAEEARDTQVPPSNTDSGSVSIQAETTTQFVPFLGSWAKPLIFKPLATPPDPSTPREYDSVGNQLASLWPSLNNEILNKKQKSKLSPQSRNLFRTASPTYRFDGTPEVSIPSKVLKLGHENKDEYIIGKFHRCSLPPGGLVHAVANKIWGRSCKISCKKLSESSYMFHIPHQPTRQWVIQRGVWHIDDCLLFVLPWTPEGSFQIPKVSTLPVWVTLKYISDCCYSRLGISHVASGLGELFLTHKPRLDPTNMGEAKVLVEMELDRVFPKLIALDDKQGSIYLVKVEYTWIPSTCERCGSLGHKAKRCLMSSKPPENSDISVDVTADIAIVDIDHILQQQNDETVTGSLPTTSAMPHVDSQPELNINIQDVPRLHSDLIADSQEPYVSTHAPMECQDIQVSKITTSSSTPQVQEDITK
ncbi:hypothetical protein IGI04_007638 [Brassica rapa subsp. trilocularis]|uniref:CCHC-type domain-containing protein n=1 Tax=Brassica rapa subsp. trilocularis TaxID=1813537 RepID=A0ABQ7NKC6_BRACM|nr:hypothetical protein IGI04_007638 [Brassica rapa subsp. trilocularis]